jgi:D-alanyl-D-alanine carboxypeptidase (penicillin-binding protein 5/6)
MDTLRDGKFGLSNTNRLIRFYDGANGIKTGSTAAAKYCLSASAKRGNMQLISVVLGAPSTKERFAGASRLLDFGFANYALIDDAVLGERLPQIKIEKGLYESVQPEIDGGVNFIVKKGDKNNVAKQINLPRMLKCPIGKNAKVGEIIFSVSGEEVARSPIICPIDVPRVTFFMMTGKIMRAWLDF